ncbi:hypothetical protein BH18THE2_BH18THE2_38790 [soil metagenome]
MHNLLMVANIDGKNDNLNVYVEQEIIDILQGKSLRAFP